MPGPIYVSEEVLDLLNRLKATSRGIEQTKCLPAAVVLLVDLGLVRVQDEDTKNNHPSRVKALPKAWEVTVLRFG